MNFLRQRKRKSLKNACLTNKLQPDQDPKLNVKSEPDPKKIIMDPQHCYYEY